MSRLTSFSIESLTPPRFDLVTWLTCRADGLTGEEAVRMRPGCQVHHGSVGSALRLRCLQRKVVKNRGKVEKPRAICFELCLVQMRYINDNCWRDSQTSCLLRMCFGSNRPGTKFKHPCLHNRQMGSSHSSNF